MIRERMPEWRARYLAHLHDLATGAVAWDELGPKVARLHTMIADTVHADTRKLYDDERFDRSVDAIRKSVETRMDALMKHESLAGAWPAQWLLK